MSEQQEIDFSAQVSASKHSRLSANNLNKRYKKRTVVHDVSFDVKSGEVVGLRDLDGLSAEDFQRIYAVNTIGP